MSTPIKRTITGAFAVALASGAIMVGAAGAAQAQPFPGCTANPVFGTAAFSQCANPAQLHRVRVHCTAWWAPWTVYERYGNYAWGWQQSWTSCDVPFTLRGWDVVHF